MHDRQPPSQDLPRALLALETLILERERRLHAARLHAQRLAALPGTTPPS